MLKNFFEKVKENKENYSDARDGDQFEQKIKNYLKAYGFSEIIQRPKTQSSIKEIMNLENIPKNMAKEYFFQIKKEILSKNSIEITLNPFANIKNTFIFQPFGSQNFPDFIIFTEKHIIPIEIKYSKNNKKNKDINIHKARPMWNSNMPKPNAIYVYGIPNKLITFFMGFDILDYNTRQVLLDYFDELNKEEENLENKLENLKNNFGIYPYLRKAYEHKKNKSTFLDINGKQIIESYFSEKSEEREKNVIEWLNKLEK